ncbi:helix-turn-helix domain-containing protein [Streptomyces sp. NPDC046862]|uniref:winged helix-turn-helix transcriptional regulator n=1 Tax=Streptomyces sp. NPDC046862 TaxID=3154603 RepID=UPI003452DE3C
MLGLVSRTAYPTVPPRVDYELTELGRTLLTPISALHEWAVAHRDGIRHARAHHDHTADGRAEHSQGAHSSASAR